MLLKELRDQGLEANINFVQHGPISRELRTKHCSRKHGNAAYYGQDLNK